MSKFLMPVLLFLICFSAVAEETAYLHQVKVQSEEAKKSGIAMVVSGTVMMIGGAAMISTFEKDEKDGDGIAAKGTASAGMGTILAGVGLTLDIAGIIRLRESKQLMDDAKKREGVPVSLKIAPGEIGFVASF